MLRAVEKFSSYRRKSDGLCRDTTLGDGGVGVRDGE